MQETQLFLSFSCPFHICNYIYQYVMCSSTTRLFWFLALKKPLQSIWTNLNKPMSLIRSLQKEPLWRKGFYNSHTGWRGGEAAEMGQLSECSQASTEPWAATKPPFPSIYKHVQYDLRKLNSLAIKNLCKPLTPWSPTLPKFKERGGKVLISCSGTTRLCPAPAQSLSGLQCLQKNQQHLVQTQGWAWL